MQLRFNIAIGGIKTDGDNILAAAPGASNLEKSLALQTDFDSTELANIVSRYRNAFIRNFGRNFRGNFGRNFGDDC